MQARAGPRRSASQRSLAWRNGRPCSLLPIAGCALYLYTYHNMLVLQQYLEQFTARASISFRLC